MKYVVYAFIKIYKYQIGFEINYSYEGYCDPHMPYRTVPLHSLAGLSVKDYSV